MLGHKLKIICSIVELPHKLIWRGLCGQLMDPEESNGSHSPAIESVTNNCVSRGNVAPWGHEITHHRRCCYRRSGPSKNDSSFGRILVQSPPLRCVVGPLGVGLSRGQLGFGGCRWVDRVRDSTSCFAPSGQSGGRGTAGTAPAEVIDFDIREAQALRRNPPEWDSQQLWSL